MRAADLTGKNIVIWGVGREGLAAAAFLRRAIPGLPLTFVDEASGTDADKAVIRQADEIAGVIGSADVIIKSPGVSLYHPLIQKALAKGTCVTSLLNLWLAVPRFASVIGVTGSKGKSTTASLLAHALNALGKKAALAGNIGVPVTQVPDDDADYLVIEVSSYQASTLSHSFDIGILTSLFPEHLDWHRSLDAYYRDKLNLLAHSNRKFLNAAALGTLRQNGLSFDTAVSFNSPEGLHAAGGQIYDGGASIGPVANSYLARPGYVSNVCAALAVLKSLGFDLATALAAMESFRGLPHRQQELGEQDGILFVDDSISTTPQSAIAALQAYSGRPITLIAGGHDRGIDYAPLVDSILENNLHAVICMGPSGGRIFDQLQKSGYQSAFCSDDMREVVALAKKHTPVGGVVLLSPAAPSYGLFKNFEERGERFARESGIWE